MFVSPENCGWNSERGEEYKKDPPLSEWHPHPLPTGQLLHPSQTWKGFDDVRIEIHHRWVPSKHQGLFCCKAICLIFFGPWGSLAHNGVGVLKKWVFMRRNKKIDMAYLLDLVTSREHWLHPFTSSIGEVLLVRDLVPEKYHNYSWHTQAKINHSLHDRVGSNRKSHW